MMNREQRLALIDKLKFANAATLEEKAVRRYQREQREFEGDYGDDHIERSAPSMIFKTKPDAMIEPAPSKDFEVEPLTLAEVIADEVGTITGRLERELTQLRDRLAKLESKI